MLNQRISVLRTGLEIAIVTILFLKKPDYQNKVPLNLVQKGNLLAQKETRISLFLFKSGE